MQRWRATFEPFRCSNVRLVELVRLLEFVSGSLVRFVRFVDSSVVLWVIRLV